MRTTLSLDEDVASKLEAELPLRRGLATGRRKAFKIAARDLGDLESGISLDNVADLIERVEGAHRR